MRWDKLLSDGTVDDAVSKFYSKLRAIIGENVRLKKRNRAPDNKQPWWNSEFRNLKNRLRICRKRYFQFKSEQHKAQLRDVENQYNSMNVRCFHAYIHRIEENVKTDPKSFWSFAKSRKMSNAIPQNVHFRGITAETPSDSANLFSSFFRSVLSNNSPPLLESYLNGLPQYSLN